MFAVSAAAFVAIGLASAFAAGMLSDPFWHLGAHRAVTPIRERSVRLPPQPESSEWTVAPVGYRGVQYVPPPRRGAVSLDPSRDRGPDVRVLPGNRALAVRIRTGRGRHLLVRIDTAREGEHVIARALACVPKTPDPDWHIRLAVTLEPLLDSLLHEMTGLRPV